MKPSPLFTTLIRMVIICWPYRKYIDFRIGQLSYIYKLYFINGLYQESY